MELHPLSAVVQLLVNSILCHVPFSLCCRVSGPSPSPACVVDVEQESLVPWRENVKDNTEVEG